MTNTPYFALLRARLDFLGDRQKLIAENIANASTPGYTPRDLDAKAFEAAMARAVESADSGRMKMPAGRVVTRPDSETTLDGNSVVLEDQAMRAMDVRMQFETGLSLYQKGLQLMRLAARPPGR
ncbi:MAG: flagellar basal body protein [Hyphomonadaceae bacterium]|nr:flagellar basal body protein [Hyphomonadaceae bacterium]